MLHDFSAAEREATRGDVHPRSPQFCGGHSTGDRVVNREVASMGLVKQLWQDQSGAVLSSELVLVTSLTVAGALAGLESIRDAVVAEMSDTAHTIQAVNDAYLHGNAAGLPNRELLPTLRQAVDSWENLGIEVSTWEASSEPADPTAN
jgi:hypothetical protein